MVHRCDHRRCRPEQLDLKSRIEVEGKMATLKGPVDSMADQMGVSAAEVTRVALEVGM